MTEKSESAVDRFLKDRGLLFGELTGGRLGLWTLPVAAGVEALAGRGWRFSASLRRTSR